MEKTQSSKFMTALMIISTVFSLISLVRQFKKQ